MFENVQSKIPPYGSCPYGGIAFCRYKCLRKGSAKRKRRRAQRSRDISYKKDSERSLRPVERISARRGTRRTFYKCHAASSLLSPWRKGIDLKRARSALRSRDISYKKDSERPLREGIDLKRARSASGSAHGALSPDPSRRKVRRCLPCLPFRRSAARFHPHAAAAQGCKAAFAVRSPTVCPA